MVSIMYGIFITSWYQEKGGCTQVEHYNSIEFKSIDKAINFLSIKYSEIKNYYPVESVEIKLIK